MRRNLHRALALYVIVLMVGSSNVAAGPPKVGDTAHRFRLPTLNPELSGAKWFSVRNHIGTGAKVPKRALLLSFAASYCKPCRKELPELKTLAARYAPRGVLTVVVVIDTEEAGVEEMRRLTVATLALPFPVVRARFGIVARRYGAERLPHSVIVGADGSIKWLKSGYDNGTLETIAQQLDKLTESP